MNDLVDPERFRAELEQMRELIQNDPQVRARFDRDGNGVIDGEEWEAVRQVVFKRLETEAMEAEFARQLYEQLDDEQAAELARMEADIEADDRSEPMEPSEPARDFSGLELAFDPRADRSDRDRSVAEEVYEREVAGRLAGSRVSAREVRLSEAGTLADRTELILEQGGGAKQFFGRMFRREYIVRDSEGTEIGRIGQRENEMLQNLTEYRVLDDPDLNFRVHDHVSDEEFHFRRSSGISENSIDVYNPRKRTIARTSWTLSFLRRTYEIRNLQQGVSYYVRRRLLRPWTFDVLDPFDEPIGTMQRGWSGLGFLTAGNLFHIELDTPVPPETMWGLLATALLADLDSEHGSRRSALDLFNN